MTKVVIYARVSTQGQDYERQLIELRDYAKKMNYEIVEEFTEKISGAKHIAEREALTQLLEFVKVHKVDKVLVYECSRLSRRAVDFLSIIETLTSMKISFLSYKMDWKHCFPMAKRTLLPIWFLAFWLILIMSKNAF